MVNVNEKPNVIIDALEICKTCGNKACIGMNCEHIRNFWEIYVNRDKIKDSSSNEHHMLMRYTSLLTQANLNLHKLTTELKNENNMLKIEVAALKRPQPLR